MSDDTQMARLDHMRALLERIVELATEIKQECGELDARLTRLEASQVIGSGTLAWNPHEQGPADFTVEHNVSSTTPKE